MRTKNYLQKLALDYLQRLSDVRFAGQVLFVVLVLLISWSGVKSVQSNYGLQKQISGVQQEIAVKKLENTNLALQNQYYKSDQYQELAARQNFGLAAPGEKVLLVPEAVALKYTVEPPAPAKKTAAVDTRPAYQKHLQSWVDFFLHRQPADN